jgi:catechol 2,3-dioxygenase-like lactoylglutathione lyase family enzyme
VIVPRIEGARFGHVNVTSADWRRLAVFYEDLFGCALVPPERDHRGSELESATGIPGAHLTGAHLRLPGHGAKGPTIEIYQYESVEPGRGPRVDRAGWGHVAFQVPDVAAALGEVLAAGGGRIGDVITSTTADGRQVTWCYATDPDDNILELQAWSG